MFHDCSPGRRVNLQASVPPVKITPLLSPSFHNDIRGRDTNSEHSRYYQHSLDQQPRLLISVLQKQKGTVSKEIVSMITKKMKIRQTVPSLFLKKTLYYKKGYNNNLCLLFSRWWLNSYLNEEKSFIKVHTIQSL